MTLDAPIFPTPRAVMYGNVDRLGIGADSGGQWRHPWNVRMIWQARAGRWVAQIESGYVNGQAPIYRVAVPTSGEAASDFGINPLTGKPYFSAHVFRQAEVSGPRTETLDIPLYLRPMISLPWRAAGYDGPESEPVPAYFLERGVGRPKPALDPDDIGAPQDLSASLPSANLRLLRACDLILHQPREALTSQIEARPSGLLTGDSLVTQTLGLRTPPASDALRVLPGTFRTSDAPGIDPSRLDFEEPTWDELLIATCYLLSPPNAAPGSEPDGRWSPFVRHQLFWNLSHAQPRLRWFDSDPTVPFIPMLAGGAAQLVINFLTASINDGLQNALNMITGESRAGVFWTPTGGGSTAAAPATPAAVAPARTGLDKAGQIAARTRAAAAQRRSQRLDPVFPFQALPFDPQTLLR